MYKIAVMGDRDSIYGFAAIGLEIFPVTEAAQAAKTLRRLAESEYAVVYITEGCAAMIPEEIEKYREMPIPAVIPLPGVTGNNGMGVAGVKKSVEQAVGSDILFGDKY